MYFPLICQCALNNYKIRKFNINLLQLLLLLIHLRQSHLLPLTLSNPWTLSAKVDARIEFSTIIIPQITSFDFFAIYWFTIHQPLTILEHARWNLVSELYTAPTRVPGESGRQPAFFIYSQKSLNHHMQTFSLAHSWRRCRSLPKVLSLRGCHIFHFLKEYFSSILDATFRY